MKICANCGSKQGGEGETVYEGETTCSGGREGKEKEQKDTTFLISVN